MNDALLKQRLQYVLEHGEPWPEERPVSRMFVVKLVCVVIALEMVQIAIHFT